MSKRKRHRPNQYPWDEWLRKPAFVLRKGREYVIKTGSMAQMVRLAARGRGLAVSVHNDDDRLRVEVRRAAAE